MVTVLPTWAPIRALPIGDSSLRRRLAMAELGVDAVVEIGPGRALSGFVRKTVPELPVFAVETAEEAMLLPELLKGMECK